MWEETESIYRGQEYSPEHAGIMAHPIFGGCHETFDRYLPHLKSSLKTSDAVMEAGHGRVGPADQAGQFSE